VGSGNGAYDTPFTLHWKVLVRSSYNDSNRTAMCCYILKLPKIYTYAKII